MKKTKDTKQSKAKKKLTEQEAINLSLQNYDNSKEEDIDYSDIKELDEKFFKNAVFVDYSKPKKDIHIRIDSFVLQWFKDNNKKGYQKHINEVLKQYVYTALFKT